MLQYPTVGYYWARLFGAGVMRVRDEEPLRAGRRRDLHVRMEGEMAAWLEGEARARSLSLADVVREACREYREGRERRELLFTSEGKRRGRN